MTSAPTVPADYLAVARAAVEAPNLAQETRSAQVSAIPTSDLPEPLVPAEVDLRDFVYMPLDVLRLRDSDLATLSTGDEFKAAVLLWCVAWHQVPAASLPDDDRLLARHSGALGKWRKVKAQALRGFIKCSDGRLYHPTVAEKAREAWHAKQAQRARTKAATDARENKRRAADEQRDEQRDVERDVERDVDQGKGAEGKGELREGKPLRANSARTRSDVPEENSHDHAAAVRICEALSAMGFDKVNDRDESLLRLVAAGVGEEVFVYGAAKAIDKTNPFRYLMGMLEGQYRDAEKTRGELARSSSNGGQGGMLDDPHPQWALDAGFRNRFDAENEGCLPGNASMFRDGRRVVP